MEWWHLYCDVLAETESPSQLLKKINFRKPCCCTAKVTAFCKPGMCVCLCSPGREFSLLQNLTAALTNDDAHYVIRLANGLFLQQGVTFNPEFLHLMKKYFGANVETVDFNESAAVAEHINSWVENHTESEWRREKIQMRNGWYFEYTNTVYYLESQCTIKWHALLSVSKHLIT